MVNPSSLPLALAAQRLCIWEAISVAWVSPAKCRGGGCTGRSPVEQAVRDAYHGHG